MDEDKKLSEDDDLENFNEPRISDILNNYNKSENILDNQKDEEKKENLKKPLFYNICNNILFLILMNLIQSLISLGCFYLYYIYASMFRDIIILTTVEICLFILLMIFNIIFDFLFYHRSSDDSESTNYIIFINYSLFILTNINNIMFEAFIYFLITLDKKHNQLDFEHFEARAYWKISMCFLYILLLFYYYLRKAKGLFKGKNSLILLLFSLICLILFVLLIILTERGKDNWDRFYYLIALVLELLFIILSLIIFDDELEEEQTGNIWMVNAYYSMKSGLWILPGIVRILVSCCEIFRCFRKIYDNYN